MWVLFCGVVVFFWGGRGSIQIIIMSSSCAILSEVTYTTYTSPYVHVPWHAYHTHARIDGYPQAIPVDYDGGIDRPRLYWPLSLSHAHLPCIQPYLSTLDIRQWDGLACELYYRPHAEPYLAMPAYMISAQYAYGRLHQHACFIPMTYTHTVERPTLYWPIHLPQPSLPCLHFFTQAAPVADTSFKVEQTAPIVELEKTLVSEVEPSVELGKPVEPTVELKQTVVQPPVEPPVELVKTVVLEVEKNVVEPTVMAPCSRQSTQSPDTSSTSDSEPALPCGYEYVSGEVHIQPTVSLVARYQQRSSKKVQRRTPSKKHNKSKKPKPPRAPRRAAIADVHDTDDWDLDIFTISDEELCAPDMKMYATWVSYFLRIFHQMRDHWSENLKLFTPAQISQLLLCIKDMFFIATGHVCGQGLQGLPRTWEPNDPTIYRHTFSPEWLRRTTEILDKLKAHIHIGLRTITAIFHRDIRTGTVYDILMNNDIWPPLVDCQFIYPPIPKFYMYASITLFHMCASLGSFQRYLYGKIVHQAETKKIAPQDMSIDVGSLWLRILRLHETSNSIVTVDIRTILEDL
jgi:hypothetical protein